MEWLAKIIQKQVKEFGEIPLNINCGLCYDFSKCLIKKIRNHEKKKKYSYIPKNVFSEEVIGKYLVTLDHAWVVFKGKCYDAETPYGVKQWYNLPHFKSHKKRLEKYVRIF